MKYLVLIVSLFLASLAHAQGLSVYQANPVTLAPLSGARNIGEEIAVVYYLDNSSPWTILTAKLTITHPNQSGEEVVVVSLLPGENRLVAIKNDVIDAGDVVLGDDAQLHFDVQVKVQSWFAGQFQSQTYIADREVCTVNADAQPLSVPAKKGKAKK